MSAQFQIIGGSGSTVKVTTSGEIVVAPLSYDEIANQTLDSANVAENFFAPISNKQFVITGIVANADKAVTTDVVVDVFEADSLTSATIDKAIFHFEMLKNGDKDLTGLRILVNSGVFINGKADDANVNITIMGYYIDRL